MFSHPRPRELFSALSSAESGAHAKVKAAVVKTYELVPEAYRQSFS